MPVDEFDKIVEQMPSPSPAPTATPPVIGIFGQPLTPGKGATEYREQAKDGGYILWKRQKNSKGEEDWWPVKYFPPPGKVT